MATAFSKDNVKSKLGWSNSFSRDGAFPLDIHQYFGSYAEAEAAAATAVDFGSTESVYYYGMQVYVFDGSDCTAYLIQGDNTLKEVGSASASETIVVSNETEMLALTDLVVGQQVFREDTNTLWLYKGADPSDINCWAETGAASDTIWYNTETKVIFYALNQATYDAIATKNDSTLYFIIDSGKIYKGDTNLTDNIIVVDQGEVPALSEMVPNKLYLESLNSTYPAYADGPYWIYFTTDNINFHYIPGVLTEEGFTWAEASGTVDEISQLAPSMSLLRQELGALAEYDLDDKTVAAHINQIYTDLDAADTNNAVSIEESTSDDYAKIYTIKQGSSSVGTINIPKDMVVQSGTVEIDPVGQDAGTYLVLTLANSSNDTIYINVGDLVDIYTVSENASQVQLEISTGNVIEATLVAGGVGTTELADASVTTAKVVDGAITVAKLADGVKTSLGLADSAVQSVTTGTVNGTISVDGTNVSVYGLGSAAYTASSAYDAAGAADAALESAKAYTDDAVSNVDVSGAESAANEYTDAAIEEALSWGTL